MALANPEPVDSVMAGFFCRFASAGGIYFDNNMNPMINTPAAAEGLQNMVDSLKSCPPDVLS
ncbi:MAG: hypothetical protein JO279_14745 [Verrucomicrobia bacterium]|nr:hypothetical protein [Verrucomicrobiota bacterium]